MLSRPSECNTRTPNDVRIYANKAAFEGQALRSMVNGLQARTKYKLSTEMSQFAERCYEERLLFYVSEAMLICVRDDAGRIKAEEILDGIEENDEQELRVVWTPLLDECVETLSLKSMESSRIRLSKMSDLWNKRTNQKKLRNVFNKFVRYGARQDMTKVDGCREFLQDMIRSTAETAANCYGIASQTPEFSTENFQTVADKGLTDYIVEIYTWESV
ncbi:hypothetical protein PFISCL1PPCAC_18667 [Pristionchus fissidentatus]|uniref:Cullin N-terminal domain-containing protein n=1 Tax=Pristionchus fissidentatus TaxID=1538716 RepID=A0AAV5WC16_9BILA|nr:hypothetical protein PFISCL1PPCAC_18667 [Pristionchus fissidentatus]